MSLSRRGFLFALGLALPATTLLAEDAEAATDRRNRRRKPAAQANAHAKPKAQAQRPGKAHAANRRRRHTTT